MSFLLTNSVKIICEGVTYDSLTDFNLAIENTDYIKTPVLNENQIVVNGRNGVLDFTDSVYDGPTYQYREIRVTLGTIANSAEAWDMLISDIRKKFHGKIIKLIFKTTEDYYFTGRCTIEDFKRKRALGSFDLCINYAYPYMYKNELTEVSAVATTLGKTIACSNDSMPVCPTFICNGSTVISFGDITESVPAAGTYQFGSIVFKEGINNVVVKGRATVKVSYREGRL